ncbi:MAG: DNA cytosine methyltransferase [Terracidiphilus sp.]|jgi:DNA (cytosine-5)-methyltransferase 1
MGVAASGVQVAAVRSSVVQEAPRIVSLFCGAGGLDVGFHESGFRIELALDHSTAAIKTHKRNFPDTKSVCTDLKEIGAKGVLDLLTETLPLGSRIGIIGGPPCQGFSRANSNSRSDDPRNALIPLYLQIVRTLSYNYQLEFVVFENVIGIKDRKHNAVYDALISGLASLGLSVTDQVCCALDFGVAQMRKRVIVIGMRDDKNYSEVHLKGRKGKRSVREAIGHLSSPAFFRRDIAPQDIPAHPNHWTMTPRSVRFSTPASQWKQTRSFKRTFWSKPSPTIAFGHREIHVHPSCKRRLSIYEAMLLQGFSHGFVLEGNLTEQVEQVSNAVPPPLAKSIASSIKTAMKGH